MKNTSDKVISGQAKTETLYQVQLEKFRDPIKRMMEKFKKGKDEDYQLNDFADNPYSGPVMQTEFGIFPVNDGGLFSTHFNLWTGYTNFPLQRKHAFILDTTPGIELMMVKTPYRFIIGIAKMFSETDVLNRVKTNLIKSMIGGLTSKLGDLKKSLSKQYKFFAIINFQGKNHVLHGKSEAEVDSQVENFVKKNGQQEIEYSWTKAKSS